MTTVSLSKRLRILPPLAATCLLLSLGAAIAREENADLPALSDRMPRVDIRFETALAGLAFFEDGMSDAYGQIAYAQTGLTFDLSPTTQFVLGAGYGRRSGSLASNDPTFDQEVDLEISMIPVLAGVRFNLNEMDRFRTNVGAYFQAVRIKEEAPFYQSYPFIDAGTRESVDWAQQFLLTVGPELRFDDGQWLVGAELMLSQGGAESDDGSVRDTSLVGFGGRLYCSWRIGTIEESVRDPEVQP